MQFSMLKDRQQFIHDLSILFEGRVKVEFDIYTRGRSDCGCRDGESSGFTFSGNSFAYDRFIVKLSRPSKISDSDFAKKLYSLIENGHDGEKIFEAITKPRSYYGVPSEHGGYWMFGTGIPTMEQWVECLNGQTKEFEPRKIQEYRFIFEAGVF